MTSATITEPTGDAIVDGRYVILSIDGHAGAEIMTYRNYLSSKYHAEFDEWVKTFVNPFDDLRGHRSTLWVSLRATHATWCWRAKVRW